MALIKCPECGKEVSEQASTCIYCGCPISKNESTPTKSFDFKYIALIGCILAIIIISVFYFNKKSSDEIVKPTDDSASNINTIKSPIDSISDSTYETAILLLDRYSSVRYQEDLTEDIKNQLTLAHGNNFRDITAQQTFDTIFSKSTLCIDALKEIDSITNETTGAEYFLEEAILTYWAYRLDEASGIVLYDESGGSYMFKINCLLYDLGDDITENSSIIYGDIQTAIENADSLEDFEDLNDMQATVRELISYIPVFDNRY